MSARCACTASTSPAVAVAAHAADCPSRPPEAAHDPDSAPTSPPGGAAPVVGGSGAGECASCAEAARVIEDLLAVRGLPPVTEAAGDPCPHAEGMGCPTCGRGRPTRRTCGYCEDAAWGAALAWLDKLRGTP